MAQLAESELGVILDAWDGLSTSAQEASKDALWVVRMQDDMGGCASMYLCAASNRFSLDVRRITYSCELTVGLAHQKRA